MYSGFRINRGRCGTWVEAAGGSSFWEIEPCEGADQLSLLMQREWGGGRVLLLPNGFAVKPLHSEDERGAIVLIGRFSGSIVLMQPDGTRFDLSRPSTLQAGDPWPGPKSTGLECALQNDGAITCNWYQTLATRSGYITEQLRGPDRVLAAGYQAARPGEVSGRIRVTANGIVITNRRLSDEGWSALYVGAVEPSSWNDWDHWIDRTQATSGATGLNPRHRR
jgi:hypothetical protein